MLAKEVDILLCFVCCFSCCLFSPRYPVLS